MKQDGSINLFHYWNRLRDTRPAPKRTEIEPADIKTLLADTFILESDARGTAIFRLAGTRLCGIYGRELKGFSFPSLWRASDQRLIAKLAHNVFNDKAVIVVAYEGISKGGRSVKFELVLLPLDGGVESQRALGIATPVTRPYWLGSDHLVDSALESVRVVDPDREPMFLKNRPAVPIPPALAPSDVTMGREGASQIGARRIRHLLVLPGGRQDR